ncbi:hypothetical protein ACFLYT_01940, partial [Nanoarchaeota archaeon]
MPSQNWGRQGTWPPNGQIRELPTRIKTLKVDVRTWDSLKSRKKENETFNDVIKELLNERTKAVGDDNIKAIKYERKAGFFKFKYGETLGVEYERNDVKSNRDDFVLDVKIKKIFFGKKGYSPSEFFGLDNTHKHYSERFMGIYLTAFQEALYAEFKIRSPTQFYDLTSWRQLYYEYNLSEESFKEDIEEPLRLSEDDKPNKKWKERIDKSPAEKIIKKKQVY